MISCKVSILDNKYDLVILKLEWTLWWAGFDPRAAGMFNVKIKTPNLVEVTSWTPDLSNRRLQLSGLHSSLYIGAAAQWLSDWRNCFGIVTTTGWFHFTGSSVLQMDHDTDICSVICSATLHLRQSWHQSCQPGCPEAQSLLVTGEGRRYKFKCEGFTTNWKILIIIDESQNAATALM